VVWNMNFKTLHTLWEEWSQLTNIFIYFSEGLKPPTSYISLHQDHQGGLILCRTSLFSQSFLNKIKTTFRKLTMRTRVLFALTISSQLESRTRRTILCPCLFTLPSFWRWAQASYLVLRFVNLRIGSKNFRVCPSHPATSNQQLWRYLEDV